MTGIRKKNSHKDAKVKTKRRIAAKNVKGRNRDALNQVLTFHPFSFASLPEVFLAGTPLSDTRSDRMASGTQILCPQHYN
jgi:hypothetical protein